MVTTVRLNTPRVLDVLDAPDWLPLQQQHVERTHELTKDHLYRAARGIKHPVEDFLFTYYNLKPAEMKRWHPGAGVALTGATAHASYKWYVELAGSTPTVTVDATAFLSKRGGTVDYIETLFKNTMGRPATFGCFGLHEWAMVYHLTPEQMRHRGLRLRLGHKTTDVVVETNPISCSHFDAYRFFTPDAKPLNELRPTRSNQPDTEQSGCLHAGMDVYKWAMKLGPLVPGDILLDTFELALDIRRVDMQASPYDVTDYGLAPIKIETTAGKQQYQQLQKGFARRGDALRLKVLQAISVAREVAAREVAV